MVFVPPGWMSKGTASPPLNGGGMKSRDRTVTAVSPALCSSISRHSVVRQNVVSKAGRRTSSSGCFRGTRGSRKLLPAPVSVSSANSQGEGKYGIGTL